jgi:hypothetical protein
MYLLGIYLPIYTTRSKFPTSLSIVFRIQNHRFRLIVFRVHK